MQLSAVRAGIAAAASAVVLPAGIRKLTCTGYTPDAVTEPHFFTAETDVDFDATYGRGMDRLDVTCRLLVGRGDDRAAQRVLDAMLSGSGPASLKAAIEAARPSNGPSVLTGVIHDLRVVRVQGYRWYEHAGTQYVGAEIIIHVIGDGRT